MDFVRLIFIAEILFSAGRPLSLESSLEISMHAVFDGVPLALVTRLGHTATDGKLAWFQLDENVLITIQQIYETLKSNTSPL